MTTRLITGGTIINATHMGEADIIIEDERVAAIVTPGSDISEAAQRGLDEKIDPPGK